MTYLHKAVSICVLLILVGSCDKSTAYEQKLIENVSQMNAQLPMMVDSQTRGNSAEMVGKSVYFKYTLVNETKKSLNEIDFNEFIKERYTEHYCNDEYNRNELEYGIEYNYIYYYKNGEHATSVVINNSSCL